MADRLTTEQRRLNMSRVRSRDTAPEWIVRRILHKHGFRYRLHRRDLPGRPDIVLSRYRTALFVNGCFWHGHDCRLFRVPATRTNFWLSKIEGNRERDTAARQRLAEAGWRTLCVWECALKGPGRLDASQLAAELTDFVTGRQPACDISGFQRAAHSNRKEEAA